MVVTGGKRVPDQYRPAQMSSRKLFTPCSAPSLLERVSPAISAADRMRRRAAVQASRVIRERIV
eukprot:3204603-Rhodomonas_salina.2